MYCIVLVTYSSTGGQIRSFALEASDQTDYDQTVEETARLNAAKNADNLSYQIGVCGGMTCRDMIKCGWYKPALKEKEVAKSGV